MYSKPRLLVKYIRHLLLASNSRGHGTHSPFVYAFIRHVLMDNARSDWFARIEKIRTKSTADRTAIAVTDLGGKGMGDTRSDTIAGIARRSLSTPKFGRLLFRLAQYYRAERLLELGTSLGLSGSYLIAGAGTGAGLVSIEGSPQIAEYAKETFRSLGLAEQVTILTGNFDEQLPALMATGFSPDLVFIDGNHRQEPLLRYFNAVLQGGSVPRVIILHDIHWSAEMESGWQTICAMPEVRLSVDLFFAGIIFFDDKFLIKQHFRVRF